MTIDEAIAFERQQAKDKRNKRYTFGIQKSKEVSEEHEQLAEWLEELKKRRSEDYGYLADIHQDIGYRKAIDDFVNACKEDILCQTFGLHQNGIERIAEQLKAGGENND